MSFFKSIELKNYDLDTKINNKLKECNKYMKEKKNNSPSIKMSVEEITNRHIRFCNDMLVEKKDYELIDLVSENQIDLLEKFNISSLINSFEKILTDEEIELFNYNNDFRRKILFSSLFNIIKIGGSEKGAEYALIFAKMFSFNYSIPMHYASYDGTVYNPKLKKFISKYLEIGGSEITYWLPNYFSDNNKIKYSCEELEKVIEIINDYGEQIYKTPEISKKLQKRF